MTLDEILEATRNEAVFWADGHGGEATDMDKEKAKEAIKQWAVELIGEDEPNNYHGASPRNALRSELKQKIQEAE